MNRRIVLGAGVVAAAATAGWIALPSGKHPLTIAAATDALARLRGTKINHAGGWNPAQVCAHLAQSIEYSMTGFPQPKSALFQSTMGAAAFAVFHSKGAMKHSLTEPIPGAPAIAATDDQTAALDRVLKALADFDKFNGALQPHFAYGTLDKKAYAAAHAMHVYNHLTEFSVA